MSICPVFSEQKDPGSEHKINLRIIQTRMKRMTLQAAPPLYNDHRLDGKCGGCPPITPHRYVRHADLRRPLRFWPSATRNTSLPAHHKRASQVHVGAYPSSALRVTSARFDFRVDQAWWLADGALVATVSCLSITARCGECVWLYVGLRSLNVVRL